MDPTVAIFTAECRTLFRSTRTWIVVITVCVIVTAIYASYAMHFRMSGIGNPSATPPRLMIDFFGGSYLLLMIIGLSLLGCDSRIRDQQHGIAEVLHASSQPNLSIVIARTFALAAFGWLPVVLLLAFAQGAGMLDLFASTGQLQSFEWRSLLAFVFLHCPLVLIVFAALTQMFVSVAGSRWAVVACLFAIVSIMTFGILQAPLYVHELVKGLPFTGHFASDMIRGEVSPVDLVSTWAFAIAGIVLVLFAAVLYPRTDDRRPAHAYWCACTFTLASVTTIVVTHVVLEQKEQRLIWLEKHKEVLSEPRFDTSSVRATIVLNPGQSMSVDATVTGTMIGDQNLRDIVFSLNPGLSVHRVSVDDTEQSFVHENGLLTLTSNQHLRGSKELELRVRASGSPEFAFAYLDSAIDKWNSSLWESQLHLLGLESGIFDRDFVGLVPSIAWLPTPGASLAMDDATVNPKDFYALDLEVDVPQGWSVAAIGERQTISETDERTVYRFRTGFPVSDVSIYASKFAVMSTTIADVEFELLIEPQHRASIDRLAPGIEGIKKLVADRLKPLRDAGLLLPCEAYRLIEVPSRLRVYGGGAFMNSIQASQCLFLMREQDFPANTLTNVWIEENAERWESWGGSIYTEILRAHFSHAYTGSDFGNRFVRQYLLDQTSPTGEEAAVLERVLDSLTQLVSTGRTFSTESMGAFSPYAFAPDVLDVHSEDTWGLASYGYRSGIRTTWMDRIFQHVSLPVRVTDHVLEGFRILELATTNSMRELYQGRSHAAHVAALEMRCAALAEKLHFVLGQQSSMTLVTELRSRFSGKTFTVDDFNGVLYTLEPANIYKPYPDYDVESAIGDWYDSSAVAGFRVSDADLTALPDSGDGKSKVQSVFHVRNTESTAGVIGVSASIPNSSTEAFSSAWYFADTTSYLPFVVPGHKSVEVRFVTDAIPLRIFAEPRGLSKNDRQIGVRIAHQSSMEHLPKGESASRWGISASDWEPPEEYGTVVDNLDREFVAGVGDEFEPRSRYWETITFPTAWGDYRQSFALGRGAHDDETAYFEAELDRRATWNLEYHIPDLRGGAFSESVGWRTTKRIFLPLDAIDGVYEFEIESDSTRQRTTLEFTKTQRGWIGVGQFEIGPGSVRVVVLPRPEGKRILADAIRWTAIEPRSGD